MKTVAYVLWVAPNEQVLNRLDQAIVVFGSDNKPVPDRDNFVRKGVLEDGRHWLLTANRAVKGLDTSDYTVFLNEAGGAVDQVVGVPEWCTSKFEKLH